jgi:hypothetical protein
LEETAAPLSRCYTSHFKGVKYLYNILKLFLQYCAVIISLHARVVGLLHILLVCWFLFGAVCSCSVKLVHLMMVSLAETCSVRIVGRNKYFGSVNFNTSTKMHRDG